MTNTSHDQGEDAPEAGIQLSQRIGAWKITMWIPFAASVGGPQELVIEPHEEADPQEVARGITSTVLRQIDTAGVWEKIQPARDLAIAGHGEIEEFRRKLAGLPKGISDEYLALLSALYVRFVNRGVRAPIHVLEVWTETKQATLKGHLRAARQRGFLTKVEGKAGGQLTDKAVETLKGIDAEQERQP
ncbi:MULTISPECIES: hypothetical protein [Streptomyces]|uniref:DNA-binding protein n=1 Tax=Streptomyces celluloflavus TaxID=58344 RepID=A0ABW7RM09_9ACTN|nr:hypothetical protein [Streptomyces sp. SID7805]MYU52124.1 hypothetical protein [Streptomyces sp. SID7805]